MARERLSVALVLMVLLLGGEQTVWGDDDNNGLVGDRGDAGDELGDQAVTGGERLSRRWKTAA
jgi:hypothetical protein